VGHHTARRRLALVAAVALVASVVLEAIALSGVLRP